MKPTAILTYIFKQIKTMHHRFLMFKIAIKNSSVPREKVVSINMEELISLWLSVQMPYGYHISLTDIAFSEKGIDFWAKLPNHITRQFVYSDVVVLSVKDLREAKKIMEATTSTFAKAALFKDSELLYTNHTNLVEKL